METQIQQFPDTADSQSSMKRSPADIAADFAYTLLFPYHRGVIDCDAHFVIYGTRGYADCPLSQREAELVMERLSEHKPQLGISANGFSWAIVVTDHTRTLFSETQLHQLVMDAWKTACDEVKDGSGQ